MVSNVAFLENLKYFQVKNEENQEGVTIQTDVNSLLPRSSHPLFLHVLIAQ
jgi:hypothetical protein